MFDIATGISAHSRTWKNKRISWADMVEKLRASTQTRETLKEFLKMAKADQNKIKDVGGYVGGYLNKGRRSAQSVRHRQLVTLDLDFATLDFWDDFTLSFGCAAVLHATHKHSEDNPRFRLVIPLDRPVNADEYQAISRRIAGDLGIELFDSTTFQPNRLMYWPSHPTDREYYFREQSGEYLDADDVLGTYADWADSSSWPTTEKAHDDIQNRANK